MAVDHSQWNILGYFHFHDDAVVLKSSPDEDDYLVIKMHRNEQEEPVHKDILSEAREVFILEVARIINYTSGSDLSLYMQQRAVSVSPMFI